MSATATKARKLADAHEKAARRVEELAAISAGAVVEDFGDAGKALSARRAVEDARAERDMLATALKTAEAIHAAAVAQEAARELEARHAVLRAEAVAVGEDIVKALVTFGRLATEHKRIVAGLPAIEFYRYHIPTYYEAASRQLVKDTDTSRQGATLQLDIRLVVPNP